LLFVSALFFCIFVIWLRGVDSHQSVASWVVREDALKEMHGVLERHRPILYCCDLDVRMFVCLAVL